MQNENIQTYQKKILFLQEPFCFHSKLLLAHLFYLFYKVYFLIFFATPLLSLPITYGSYT